MKYDGDNTAYTGFERDIQSEFYTEDNLTPDRIGIVSAANNPKAYYDWFIVRKYAEEDVKQID